MSNICITFIITHFYFAFNILNKLFIIYSIYSRKIIFNAIFFELLFEFKSFSEVYLLLFRGKNICYTCSYFLLLDKLNFHLGVVLHYDVIFICVFVQIKTIFVIAFNSFQKRITIFISSITCI